MFDSPRDHRIAGDSNAVRIRDHDRSFEKSALFNPMRAGHLAVTVQTERSRVNRIVQRIVSPRNDRGHTSADRSFANNEFSFATNNRCVTNFDTRDIGNRVQWARPTVERNSDVTRTNNFLF